MHGVPHARRAAGRCCARPRAASCAAPRPAPALPGRPPARTPTAAPGRRDLRAGRRPRPASLPDRGSTRPRYLIRSARVQVLFSCWASATAFCAARVSSSSLTGTGPGSRGPRVRGPAAAAVPHRRRDRRQRDAERARELVRPARVQLREIQRAFLRRARGEIRRLREVRELALRRRAAVALLEPRRAGAQVRGDRLAPRGEHAHHLAADALDLEAMAVIARDPLEAEPVGERFFQVLGDDRGDRADVLVVAQRVRRPPFPVDAGPGDVGDLGVDVQLHVTVAGGVLQPVRHRQVRLVPLAGLPAMHPRAVGAGAGIARLALEVFEPGVHGLPDHVVDLGDQAGPVLIAVVVAGLAGQAGVLAEGGVEDRDRLGQRQGQVEEQGALPGPADSLGPQLAPALGGGVRLGGQQLRCTGRRLCGRCPECRPSWVPSGAWRSPNSRSYGSRSTRWPGSKPSAFAPGPHQRPGGSPRSRWPGCSSWPRPWPGRGRPASRCSQGHSPCSGSRLPPTGRPGSGAGDGRTDHAHRMMHGCDALEQIMRSRVAKRAIKIRNEKRTKRT